MEKITLAQKELIKSMLIVLLILGGVWFIFFVPMSRQVLDLKYQWASADVQIKAIELHIGQELSVGEGIIALEKQLGSLQGKLPQKEEESLQSLTVFAQKNSVDVVSLRPAAKVPFEAGDNQPVGLEGKKIFRLPVTMEFTCQFKDLVQYLKELQTKMPAYVTVEKLWMIRDPQGIFKLQASVDLSLYLLS